MNFMNENQVEFELKGNLPFKSNSRSVIDFGTVLFFCILINQPMSLLHISGEYRGNRSCIEEQWQELGLLFTQAEQDQCAEHGRIAHCGAKCD
jgi:hypothetical protein